MTAAAGLEFSREIVRRMANPGRGWVGVPATLEAEFADYIGAPPWVWFETEDRRVARRTARRLRVPFRARRNSRRRRRAYVLRVVFQVRRSSVPPEGGLNARDR